ncbi:hypothetical protein KTT_34260 [Tengunoibacter tsumagoiensis]|uniref:Uncharacterized protein n=1 Tax=Tengunoibacter tsumagoiensis TaxID=2014871 RepID=A0A402A339_9CHLR|nr:hypothetical protein KTT_34260 [Tengunoibacter tsumagoiensis]
MNGYIGIRGGVVCWSTVNICKANAYSPLRKDESMLSNSTDNGENCKKTGYFFHQNKDCGECHEEEEKASRE